MKPDKAELLAFPVREDQNLNPDLVLENLKGTLDGFILAGYDKDGNEFFSITFALKKDVLWLAERMKQLVLEDDPLDE